MATNSEYIIVTIDGSESVAVLRPAPARAGKSEAPNWLLRRLGLPERTPGGWWLVPGGEGGGKAAGVAQASGPPRLHLVRRSIAAASSAPFDPRQARLRTERLRLEKLNSESDYVRVEFLDVLPGSEPERYRVTFICKGISGIDSSRNPIYAYGHTVEITCGDDFPLDVPQLRWVTDIWHPNIQHTEPKGVCVNRSEWLGGMGLDDLCRMMFEMAQYKNYHAVADVPPYPLDHQAAKWVIDYAEPLGIVNKHRSIFVDDKPFTKPTATTFIRAVTPTTPALSSRVRIASPAPPAQAAPARTTGAIKVLSSATGGTRGTGGAPSPIRIRKSE